MAGRVTRQRIPRRPSGFNFLRVEGKTADVNKCEAERTEHLREPTPGWGLWQPEKGPTVRCAEEKCLMVINPDRLQEVAMGDDEFLCELIDLYLNDAPLQVEALRDAVSSQDGAAVLAAAHKLKGSCGNVGADGLVALCQRLEASGKASRLQELPDLLQQLSREFEEVNEALHSVKTGSQLATGPARPESA